MDKLTIDPEFRDKIPPLTEDEFSLLKETSCRMGRSFRLSLYGMALSWTDITAMRSSRNTLS